MKMSIQLFITSVIVQELFFIPKIILYTPAWRSNLIEEIAFRHTTNRKTVRPGNFRYWSCGVSSAALIAVNPPPISVRYGCFTFTLRRERTWHQWCLSLGTLKYPKTNVIDVSDINCLWVLLDWQKNGTGGLLPYAPTYIDAAMCGGLPRAGRVERVWWHTGQVRHGSLGKKIKFDICIGLCNLS